MTTNYYVTCNTCSTGLRLRAQIGYKNINVDFYCPVCNTHIIGKVIIPQNPDLSKKSMGIEFNIDNVSYDKNHDNLSDYVVELSSEFLQARISKDTELIKLTPFMRTFSQIGEDGIEHLNTLDKNYDKLLSYKNDFIVISDLWNNNKLDILTQKVNNLKLTKLMIHTWRKPNRYKITREIEMLMAVHQSRNFLITPFNEKKRVERINKFPELFSIEIYPYNTEQLIAFSLLIGSLDFFKDFEKRMHELTVKYIELLPDLIPIINNLEYNKENLKSKLYTITSKYVLVLTDFYAKCYELFCDKIDLILGLNNIFMRSDFNKFGVATKKDTFIEVINSFNSKFKKYNDLLVLMDKFSPAFIGLVSNKIRNAEGHFNREFVIDENAIRFIDNHRGNLREEVVDYLEFVAETIKLFNALNELFEYSYQIDKIYRKNKS